jgi:hypothetical protein
MKRQVRPILALVSGVVLLSGVLCPKVQAQSEVITSGTSTLAPTVMPVGGFGSNPQEYLVVTWSVTENTISDVYTYSYDVKNPAGDVVLNNNGTLTTAPQTVNNIEATFNTTVLGAVLGTPPTPSGGGYVQVTSVGISWTFPAVNPGGVSALLTFTSDLAPGMGTASANPAPWASTSPNGQQVPVPIPLATPEPTTTALLGLVLLLVPFRPCRCYRLR